jgi:hypothetical protein
VGLEISGISVDELGHADYCVEFNYRYARDLQPDSNPHGEVHL